MSDDLTPAEQARAARWAADIRGVLIQAGIDDLDWHWSASVSGIPSAEDVFADTVEAQLAALHKAGYRIVRIDDV